jgi:Tfp pilus assembly protein PilX
MSRHKRASAGAIALLFVLVAVTLLPALLSSSTAVLSDATSCSGWGSASQAQQTAYSRLYLNEHGVLASGASDPNSIKSAVSNACIQAAYLGEADDVSVIAAIKHQY